MRRHLPQPRHTRVFAGGGGVETTRHRMRNKCLALFFRQRNHALLRRHQRIDAGTLAVEEGGDGLLLGEGGQGEFYVRYFIHADVLLSIHCTELFNLELC